MPNIPGAVTDPSRVRGEAIELKSGSDTIHGYLARPSQPGRNPGIVVIHEAFGLVEHIRDIARRFGACNGDFHRRLRARPLLVQGRCLDRHGTPPAGENAAS